MHELAICQEIVAQVQAIARERHATVSHVRIGIGPLAGVEPDLVDRAYPFACAGTEAEGSHLAIERLPVEVRCRECGTQSRATVKRLACSACGSWRTDVMCGDELLLLQVETMTD
jgi:hydrogenase nickel incorporation protein HypA/HybF